MPWVPWTRRSSDCEAAEMWKTYASFSGQAGASAIPASPVRSPSAGSGGGWHPTVLYLLGLVIAEIIAVALLSHWLLKA